MKLSKSEMTFLAKVGRREVYRSMGYTTRRGAYTKFYGGESTFDALRVKGLVTIGVPRLGIRAFAELTEAGKLAIGDTE